MFLLALVVRLAYLFLAAEPLAYAHHFASALRIAQHPDPVGYVLGSDDWRAWGTDASPGWTLAPLYYLFAAAVAGVFGPRLLALQLAQCLLEALTAVGVARLGRLLAGPAGGVAGVAYAVSWQAVVFHAGADTENVHTVLLVWGLGLLAGAGGSVRATVAGGLLFGLSALARPVGLAFLPILAAWQWASQGGARGLRRAALTAACVLLVVGPWLWRCRRLSGELVPIETVSVYNLWNDNAFVDEGRWGRQARIISRQPSFAARRTEAVHFAVLGWTRAPEAGLQKIADGAEYFFRPVDLHNLAVARLERPAWRHFLALVFGDALFALAVVLAAAFAAAGPRSGPRILVLAWMAYYLLLLVVVFHTQVRYRTAFTPFLFACAAGGWRCLAADAVGERRRAAIGGLLGLAWVVWASSGQLAAAFRGLPGG